MEVFESKRIYKYDFSYSHYLVNMLKTEGGLTQSYTVYMCLAYKAEQ